MVQDASAILDELPQDALTEEAVPGVQGFEFGSIVGICSFEGFNWRNTLTS